MHGVDLKSLQRAKGIYGGGDMLRPRTKPKSGAHTLLLKSSTILSRTFGSAVVGFVMFFVFFWLRSRYYIALLPNLIVT